MSMRFCAGAGRLCLDFSRTLRHRGTSKATEELPDAAALTAWIDQFGPCEEPGTGDAEEARALREAIFTLISSARTPEGVASCTPETRERVNRAAAHPTPSPTLDATGRLSRQAADPVRATLSLVARDALDLVSTDALSRVRNCADPGCGVMFSDSSRPGTRRWCSMGSCGNRAKKNTLRAKTTT